jgi:hypothetical protein
MAGVLLNFWATIPETTAQPTGIRSFCGFDSECACHETLIVRREIRDGMGLSY